MIDELDRRLLLVIARAPAGIVGISRAIESCHLTARRRINGLVGQGLASETGLRRFMISEKGRALLGADAPRPWLNLGRPSSVCDSFNLFA